MGGVTLPHRGINPHLSEHALHTKGACFIRHNRDHALAKSFVFQQRREDAHKGHRSTDLALARGLQLSGECAAGRCWQRIRRFPARGYMATQFSPPLAHVTHLWAVLGRSIERHLLEIFVADRHTEAIAERLQAFHVQLL